MRDLESEENLEKNFEDFNTNRSGDFIFFEIYFKDNRIYLCLIVALQD